MPDYRKKSFLILDSTYGGDVTRDGNISEYFAPRGMDKAIADFNWSAVFNQTAKKNKMPKIAVQAPTGDMSENDSFFKGSNPFTLGDEDFGPVAENNLALIDADEKKIEVENQFMQDDAMVNNSAQWVILPIFMVIDLEPTDFR